MRLIFIIIFLCLLNACSTLHLSENKPDEPVKDEKIYPDVQESAVLQSLKSLWQAADPQEQEDFLNWLNRKP